MRGIQWLDESRGVGQGWGLATFRMRFVCMTLESVGSEGMSIPNGLCGTSPRTQQWPRCVSVYAAQPRLDSETTSVTQSRLNSATGLGADFSHSVTSGLGDWTRRLDSETTPVTQSRLDSATELGADSAITQSRLGSAVPPTIRTR